jgi:hypothetical protein
VSEGAQLSAQLSGGRASECGQALEKDRARGGGKRVVVGASTVEGASGSGGGSDRRDPWVREGVGGRTGFCIDERGPRDSKRKHARADVFGVD